MTTLDKTLPFLAQLDIAIHAGDITREDADQIIGMLAAKADTLVAQAKHNILVQCHICKEWHRLTPDEIEMYANQEHEGLPWTCPECQQ